MLPPKNATAGETPGYAHKLDSILAFIKSYDDEQQQQEQEQDDKVPSNDVGSCDNDAPAEIARKIQQRVYGMRLEIESTSVQIELLHSLRASEEAIHLAAVKALQEKQKQFVDNVKMQHDVAIQEQKEINESFSKLHKALLKEEVTLKLRLERIISSERETIKKLEEDGTKELETVKASWLHSEKNEFKRMERKLIPKIKIETAKMVESKLKKLSEKNNDELRRLQREAAGELQSYKLERYRSMQQIIKNERRMIDATEKRLIDSIESEWSEKIEEARAENRNELTILRQNINQNLEALRIRHGNDIKLRMQKHEMDLKDASILMEASLAQQCLSHDCELKALEQTCDEEMSLRRATSQK